MQRASWLRKSLWLTLIIIGATAFWVYQLLQVSPAPERAVLWCWSIMLGTWCGVLFISHWRERERAQPTRQHTGLPPYMWLLVPAFMLFLVVLFVENHLPNRLGIALNLLQTALLWFAAILMLSEQEKQSLSLAEGAGEREDF